MSVYIAIGGQLGDQFATNRGMTDFTQWVRRLSANEYPLLNHLVDWGWTMNPSGLRDEMVRALRIAKPKRSVAASVRELLVRLSSSGEGQTVVITNGMTDIDSNGGWEIGDEE